MKCILSTIRSLPGFISLISQLEGKEPIPALGLSRASRLPVSAALQQTLQRPLILLTQKSDRALTLVDELALWAPDDIHLFFPEPTSLFYENAPWGDNTRRERITALSTLAASMIPGALKPPAPIVVAPARALMVRILPRRDFIKASLNLKPGLNTDLVKLCRQLVANGYQPSATVVVPGQFARRGGILDVWPVTDLQPSRIEFFGDQIEGLRYFDPASQRSSASHQHLMLPPSREFLVDPDTAPPEDETGWTEFHIPLLHPVPASLLDYLPPNALVLMDDWEAFRATIDELESQALSLRQDYLNDSAISQDHPLPYLTLAEIEDSLSQRQVLELGPSGIEEASSLTSCFIPNQRFAGQLKPFIDFVAGMQTNGSQVVIVSRQAARLQDVWLQSQYVKKSVAPQFIQGSLAEGWVLSPPDTPQLHLFTDGEVFGWQRPAPRQRPRLVTEAPEAGYIEFQPGDLLVHVDYGIGRYTGLVMRTLEGQPQEYLSLEYADGDLLYVPVHQLDRLTRYIGAKGRRPTISRLSSTEWLDVKSRVKRAVQAVAADLLQLYAKRQIADGYAFLEDTPWQNELEASFPYIETEDQLRVLQEVKADMETARPMDRLICGDVGYGKTEVALRAAFKAVMDGKQVAMLVPTTVLAQQHFRTFQQRLAAFPVEVEMLSRFRTPAEQQQIIHRLAQGSVDIVIGTHRLVQSDVLFRDLGLVIIDEEQRFGVTHKEHLKKLRTEVDVLTMTATPIPRTLYMALTGVRDISTIDTPPEERLPIVTHVGPFSGKVVRQAILRELERGGQVFFVHNRVQTIAGIKQQVAQLVPEARIAVAHGQMPEKQLASRMHQFANGEIDVLLSTSIIESGLDIPNANTLIVDRADTFGLAQLYQLRGRVGRGAARAYAYFFKHGQRGASQPGIQRLETLAEHTQLGAGFSIAMRDLEMRGAGDFLGTRQHGHIAAVGLNLYTRLLSQAVSQIKAGAALPPEAIAGAVVTYHPFVNIDLPLPANIPAEYVPEKELRLRLYRRLADLHSMDEIDALQAEFHDRFGELPQTTENLLYQLRVKVLAERIGLSSINFEGEQIVLRFPPLPPGAAPRVLPPLGAEVFGGKDTLRFYASKGGEWRAKLLALLEKLAGEREVIVV